MKSFFLIYLMRGQSFRVYAKFPKKLTFLTLWYAHIRKFCVRAKLMTPVNNAEAYFLTLSNIHDEAFWEAVFFQSLFLSQTLTIHWKEGKGGAIFTPLYHIHPLTNIQTFICNFASEMTTAYFQLLCLQLPDWLLLDVIFLPLGISIWLNFSTFFILMLHLIEIISSRQVLEF